MQTWRVSIDTALKHNPYFYLWTMEYKSSFMIEMVYFSTDLKTESQSSEGSRQATVALEVILSLVFVGK